MKKRILVVDDEPDIAFTIEFTLKDYDCEIIHVKNGEQCLETLRNNQIPDLILLDIMMPGMSGLEVNKKLKENPLWGKIPVVFLTARIDNTAEIPESFNGEDYIEKPYDPEDLKKRIERVLNKK
jgi:two-component system alkaline phosphatase synthesis response regulator PhoP